MTLAFGPWVSRFESRLAKKVYFIYLLLSLLVSLSIFLAVPNLLMLGFGRADELSDRQTESFSRLGSRRKTIVFNSRILDRQTHACVSVRPSIPPSICVCLVTRLRR